jgi:transposase-like protein
MAKKTRKKYPTALKSKVLRDYKRGTRVVDLAKQYGASVPTLYLWLRKGGISRAAKSGVRTGSPRLVKGLQLRVKRLELEVKRQRKRQLKLVRVLKRSLEQSLSS